MIYYAKIVKEGWVWQAGPFYDVKAACDAAHEALEGEDGNDDYCITITSETNTMADERGLSK